MKVVILCGGFGTRLSEETHLKPKPMVDIGEYPILWHIMNHYSMYGFNEFVLALGYKASVIKSYFLNYYNLSCDFTVDLKKGEVEYLGRPRSDWKVSLIDTGLETMTGGRVLRLKDYLQDLGTFMLTYGDGVSDININRLLDYHRSHGRMATVTAVRPAARFGELDLSNGVVRSFKEKPQAGAGWINGGFFVMEPGVFEFFDKGDSTILEQSPLEALSRAGQLMAYEHMGFWQCMDTVRDKKYLDDLWARKEAPWSRI